MPKTSVSTSHGLFLRQDAATHALRQIAAARRLVLYCGAGLTIDRTGVDWQSALHRVFYNSASAATHRTAEQKRVAELLLGCIKDPIELASFVMEFLRPEGVVPENWESDFLQPKLQEIFYSQNGWSEGLLLRNTVRLACLLANFGADVTIITTNYDVYIEDEFHELRKDLRATPSDGEFNFPRVVRSTFKRTADDPVDAVSALDSTQVCAPANSPSVIDIVYLHGRVAKSPQRSRTRTVLSEQAYARTRHRNTQLLRHYFSSNDATVLILGASLKDVALVDSLAATASTSGSRYALLRWDDSLNSANVQSTFGSKNLKVDRESVQKSLNLRSQHLGITSLYPDTFAQVALFVQEATVCALVDEKLGEDTYVMNEQFRYSGRLQKWWNLWKLQEDFIDNRYEPSQSTADRYYEQARNALEVVRDQLTINSHEEGLRIEVWGRLNPRSQHRKLTMLATSDGPRLDSHIPREVDIHQTPTYASVLAHQAGKPVITSLTDLAVEDTASRWKSFVSVPILVFVGDGDDGQGVLGGLVPVGVVTLASTLNRERRASQRPSALATCSNADLNSIKNTLIAAGRSLLSVRT